MSGDEVRTETVTYEANGVTLKGYLAYDSSSRAKRPGVLVVHEWWGLDDYIRGRARMLAELGYTAFAVDMYGDGQTAENPDGAGKLMNGVLADLASAEARFEAGLEVLRGQPTTDPDRIAAIGYCFGGGVVLHAARMGLDLRGVASFHGSLGSQRAPEPGSVRAQILVCHGAADSFMSDEEVQGFKDEMAAAGANCEFKAYEGALHGFTNPQATANGEKYGLPLAYDEAADRQSWHDMRSFFETVLR